MARFITDLDGKKFSYLTVLGLCAIQDKHGKSLWVCECECSNIIFTSGSQLIKNKVISCGCHKYDKHVHDITGRVIGRLTIVENLGSIGSLGGHYYRCVCECGNEVTIDGHSLRRKNGQATQSCGCLKREISSKLGKERSGEKSNFWKGGITPDHLLIRTTEPYAIWRTEVFTRDNFRCQRCFGAERTLNAHHLNSFHCNKEQRFDVNNGVCLCVNCHREFHITYTNKNNTKEQYEQWIDGND